MYLKQRKMKNYLLSYPKYRPFRWFNATNEPNFEQVLFLRFFNIYGMSALSY